ncbi:hypothetical protein BHE74_00047288 [Ensete ventricosum]|nr:hypothetical protein BHE74_00047288 [Ensete ventricosum]
MIMSLTGHDRMCCIATNYSTTIRCTMSPLDDISIAYRFSCDELGLRLLYVLPLPTPRRASAISDFWFAPLAIHLRPPAHTHSCRLWTYPFHAEEKVLMLHGVEFRSHLRMGTNTLLSVYKPLHEYRILRVSNSPHLCELCTTLTVIEQHIPLYTVSSFTKCPALP